jgi:hypothetical protein
MPSLQNPAAPRQPDLYWALDQLPGEHPSTHPEPTFQFLLGRKGSRNGHST